MSLPRHRILLSLPVLGSGYHDEQAEAARQSARRLGVELTVLSAEEDSLLQSQQLIEALQSRYRPDAIVMEPVGTCLPVVAQEALRRGVGWCVLNRNAEYLETMARQSSAPVFSLSTDHNEVGRIQGGQMAALLPEGGLALYITGPTSHGSAQRRTEGMLSTKPDNIEIKLLRSNWTVEGARAAMHSMLRLKTAQEMDVRLIVCQNDLMAEGARMALREVFHGAQLERWLAIPRTGCDGVQSIGMRLLQDGALQATIRIQANAGEAVERMEAALERGLRAPLAELTRPFSEPALERLRPRFSMAS